MRHLYIPITPETDHERERRETLVYRERLHDARSAINSKGHILLRMRTHCADCAALHVIEREIEALKRVGAEL